MKHNAAASNENGPHFECNVVMERERDETSRRCRTHHCQLGGISPIMRPDYHLGVFYRLFCLVLSDMLCVSSRGARVPRTLRGGADGSSQGQHSHPQL